MKKEIILSYVFCLIPFFFLFFFLKKERKKKINNNNIELFITLFNLSVTNI